MAAKHYCFSLSLVSLFLLHCVTALPSMLPENGEDLRKLIQTVDTAKTFLNSELAKNIHTEQETISVTSALIKLKESQDDVDDITEEKSDLLPDLVTFKLVMDVLNDKGCDWMKDVVNDKDFTCSESDMKKLSLLLSISDTTNNLKEILLQHSKEKAVSDHCSWVSCNVLCDFTISLEVREYISDSFQCLVKPKARSCPVDLSQC